ncbi:MAG TPA: ABC transporter permease [Bryobacteraceae bacterium]|jgi:predicted permease
MRLPSIFRLRLRSLFKRYRVEDELDEELRYHLERQIDENIAAGMDPREARWAALRSIDGYEQRKEECRDQRKLDMFDNLTNDIRFALRQLRKDLEFTSTAIVILALGICASVAIFAFVDGALLKPLPYKDPSRLLGVYEKIDPWCPRCNLSWPDYLDWKKQNSTMATLDIYTSNGYAMTTPSGLKPVTGARVSDGFFRTLGVTPLMGRDFYSGEDQASAARTVILSYESWQKRFGGDPNVVGRTIILNAIPNVIVGVLPSSFQFAPTGAREIWSAFHPSSECDLRRSCHGLYGVGRLKDGVSPQAAEANFVSIAQQLEKEHPDSNRNQGAAVALLSEVIVGPVRPILLVLLGGAGLLLLIACVNVTGLLLVRSESRRREMAVRTALGASTGRLFGQFTTEAFLLIAAGGTLGVLSASWLMRILVRFRSQQIADRTPFLDGIGLNYRVMAFACLIAIFAAILFAIAPSLRIFAPEIRDGLAEGSRGSAGTVWRKLGSKLVVLELATAMVLLVGAGLLGKSLHRLLTVDLGFASGRLITMQVAAPNGRYGKAPQSVVLVRQVIGEIEHVPGVKSTAVIENGLPLEGNGNTTWVRVLGRPWHGEHLEMPERDITPGYFNTLGAKLLRGRYFMESEDSTKPQVAIINEAFARVHFPNEDPIGKQLSGLSTPPIPIEIVGIVEDIREGPLDEKIPPVLYRPFYQNTDTFLNVIVRTSQDEISLMKSVTAALQAIDPELIVISVKPMNELIEDSPSAYIHRATASIVGGFAALALIMGLVGLYGVIAYSVSQRTREIGVRMALGAVPGAVYQLILREAGWLTLIGVVIGLLCSVGAAVMARGLLFGVDPWDVTTLLAIAAILSVSALIASFIPARRAAAVNPVEALRAE